MPRAATTQREARDVLVFDLWLSGESLRAIGGRPDVQLSPRAVLLAIDRRLVGAAVEAERLEALFAAAYAKACTGDERAGVAVRRVLQLLGRHDDAEAPDAQGDGQVVDARRRGVVVVPRARTPRDTVLAIAREQAGAGAVDVRLDASREYGDVVEWVFSFQLPA